MTGILEPATYPALNGLVERLAERSGDAAFHAGLVYFNKGAVTNTTVAGTTAHASVTGSSTYRITVAFGSDEVKPSCSCPAFRRNPFCKHVVAVCHALVARPGSFTPVEAAPVAEPAAKRPRSPAGGKQAAAALKAEQRAAGLETVDRLLGELTDGGLMTLGADKVAVIEATAELVRALKLRRLSNLLATLQQAARGGRGGPDDATFAGLLTDIYLARQAAGAYLDGRIPLDPLIAEDLLGRTWREAELERIGGLELIEVAFTSAHTDGFLVETAYLADITTGALYAETQIEPQRKATIAGWRRHAFRLVVGEAGLYPGAPPRRIKLLDGYSDELRLEHIERLVARAATTVAELRVALFERQRQPFATGEAVVLFRPAALVSDGNTVAALDAGGETLSLGWPVGWNDDLLPEAGPPGSFALAGALTLAPAGPRLDCLATLSTEPTCNQGARHPHW